MSVTTVNILGKGINLSEIGINDYAYSWDCIDSVLAEIEKMHLTILGGDVYAVGDCGLILTFDSWYYSPKNTLDCVFSIDKARKYIEQYIEKNGENFYFSFVFK